MGMTEFNIGFDTWTANNTVRDFKPLLERYAKRVSALAGAEPVKSDSLMAYHLRPVDIVSNYHQIVEELAWIAGEVAGL
jgi:hypothetical protein